MDYRNQWIDPPRLPRAMARSNKEWAFGFSMRQREHFQ